VGPSSSTLSRLAAGSDRPGPGEIRIASGQGARMPSKEIVLSLRTPRTSAARGLISGPSSRGIAPRVERWKLSVVVENEKHSSGAEGPIPGPGPIKDKHDQQRAGKAEQQAINRARPRRPPSTRCAQSWRSGQGWKRADARSPPIDRRVDQLQHQHRRDREPSTGQSVRAQLQPEGQAKVNAPTPQWMRIALGQKTMGQPPARARLRAGHRPHARDPSAAPFPRGRTRLASKGAGLAGKSIVMGPCFRPAFGTLPSIFVHAQHLVAQSATAEQLVLAGKHRLQAGLVGSDPSQQCSSHGLQAREAPAPGPSPPLWA